MERMFVGESVPQENPAVIVQNRELMESISSPHFRKGRLEFKFLGANEDAVSYSVNACVCTGPCGGCSSGCIAIESGVPGALAMPSSS